VLTKLNDAAADVVSRTRRREVHVVPHNVQRRSWKLNDDGAEHALRNVQQHDETLDSEYRRSRTTHSKAHGTMHYRVRLQDRKAQAYVTVPTSHWPIVIVGFVFHAWLTTVHLELRVAGQLDSAHFHYTGWEGGVPNDSVKTKYRMDNMNIPTFKKFSIDLSKSPVYGQTFINNVTHSLGLVRHCYIWLFCSSATKNDTHTCQTCCTFCIACFSLFSHRAYMSHGLYVLPMFFSLWSTYETSNLRNYWTKLLQIFRVGRTTGRLDNGQMYFIISQETLPWQPILEGKWAKL